jgi:murein DD-endopeptidase MepM/ murein hydrolase activator NlpD
MRRARLILAAAVVLTCAGSPVASAGGGGIGAPGPGETPPPSAGGSGGSGAGGAAPPAGFGLGSYVFPLDVAHTYGDGYGAGRGHEGQDLFTSCGSPVLAVRGGRIQRAGFHHRAGNYVVIDGQGTRVDTMYGHMLKRTPLRRNARVAMGEQIGRVGSTGNASGCHLHFEIWSAPGWYEGGAPMPSVGRLLRSWDV